MANTTATGETLVTIPNRGHSETIPHSHPNDKPGAAETDDAADS